MFSLTSDMICARWVILRLLFSGSRSNLAANNVTLGMLGPAVFELGFLDSCLCAVFGMLVGCLPVAYLAIIGPKSGNRTMIFSRYIMGWWPSKIVVVLNIIVLLGYAMIDCVVSTE